MTGFDLRLLAPFVVLAEELHFGRAAARLHVAQSGLSHQIKRLEQQLGVRLFERDTRHVRLSPAGHAFLSGARGALTSADQAAHDARQAGAQRTVVRLGADLDFPERILRRLRQFGTAHPQIELRLQVQHQDDLLRDLQDGRLHAVVVWTRPPVDMPWLDWKRLTRVELHGVIRRSDALAAGRCLRRDALAEYRLTLFAPDHASRAFYEFFLAEMSGSDRTGPTVAHISVLDDAQEAMLHAIEANGGFTVSAAGDVWWHEHADLISLPFDPPVHADLAVTWKRPLQPELVPQLVAHFGSTPDAIRSP